LNPSSSQMQTAANQVEGWSNTNHTNIKNMKEMMPPLLVTLHGRCIERVTSYNLLGLIITNNLILDAHKIH
jgi:hypothetical protein